MAVRPGQLRQRKIDLRQIAGLEHPTIYRNTPFKTMSTSDDGEFFDEESIAPGVSELLPERNNLIRGQASSYAVGRKIMPGKYGAVYEVLRVSDGKSFAAKLEICNTPFNGLNMDYIVLRSVMKAKRAELKDGEGHFCEFIDRGKIDGHFKFVVMQKHDTNLWRLRRRFVGHRFSASTTLRLAIETLNCIEALHKLGFVHRDIKPSNFLLTHRSGKFSQVVIIDFGICRKYRDSNGEIKPPRGVCAFRGTTRYASLTTHLEDEQSPRDDIESWMYLAVEMMTGHLPWAELRRDHRDAVRQLKEHARTPEGAIKFFEYCPRTEFRRVLKYIDSLTYYSQPDYGFLRQMLLLAMKNNDIRPDEPYDWEQAEEEATDAAAEPITNGITKGQKMMIDSNDNQIDPGTTKRAKTTANGTKLASKQSEKIANNLAGILAANKI